MATNNVPTSPDRETLSDAAMREILLEAAIAAVTAKADAYMRECDYNRRMVDVLRQKCGGALPPETLTFLEEQGALRARWRKARVALNNALNDLAQDWEKGATL